MLNTLIRSKQYLVINEAYTCFCLILNHRYLNLFQAELSPPKGAEALNAVSVLRVPKEAPQPRSVRLRSCCSGRSPASSGTLSLTERERDGQTRGQHHAMRRGQRWTDVATSQGAQGLTAARSWNRQGRILPRASEGAQS